MKKRRIVIPIIIILIIGLPCLLNMSNFYLGSNSMFFRTISDYPNTVWVCKEPDAKITVTMERLKEASGSKSVLELEIDDVKNRFRIHTQADQFVLYRLDEEDNEISDVVNDPNGDVILTRAKYKKNILGVVTSFRITASENQTIAGYRTLEFVKEK